MEGEQRQQLRTEPVIALAGNPNVGKSTVFNGLTGQHQHTGNWPGKTVASAQGRCRSKKCTYTLVDIPGIYSLTAHSAEEEAARDFLCLEKPDAVIVVCDAACLERNLKLVLQILEITEQVVVCVNLMDEAKTRGIQVDVSLLEQRMGVPVVATVARKKKSLCALLEQLDQMVGEPARNDPTVQQKPVKAVYERPVEEAAALLEPTVKRACPTISNSRWMSLRLLAGDRWLGEIAGMKSPGVQEALQHAWQTFADMRGPLPEQETNQTDMNRINAERVEDALAEGLARTAKELCRQAVTFEQPVFHVRDRKLDWLLTGRLTGYPLMLLLLAGILWLTICGAEYPSELLAGLLFAGQEVLTGFCMKLGMPEWLHGLLVLGGYRVLAWVVSVMLPPMAIFFPLFTLLEDAGYLPRVAYNLDRPFACCSACGKQALTMCMGLGCNAVGVMGCRIIDSPRERLLAILTNNFVPCNGRFPVLLTLITLFFAGTRPGLSGTLKAALLLSGVLLLGIVMTFLASGLLAKTILKGEASAFTLELPPYRKPQVGKVLVRSVFDRTLFVLGRAAAAALPAGLLIWVMANVMVGEHTLLAVCSGFLEPAGRLFGMDGVILMSFLLGLPANEIVIPVMLMAYLQQGTLLEAENPGMLRQLLLQNGWTQVTALCTLLFSLMHWPCATTLLTIRKETGSWKWTAMAFALPTAAGLATCFLVNLFFRTF